MTREQLERVGLGRRAIEHRLRNRRLHRLHRGVYLFGHAVLPPLAREVAAVFACGEGATLSHRSAAHLWGIAAAGDSVNVTVPGDRRRRDIVVHKSVIAPPDVTVRHAIPVTRPARTLLDFAEQATERELEQAFDEAVTQRITSVTQVREALDRHPGRHGAAPITALLDRTGEPVLTRSEAEELMLDLIRKGDLPPPRMNVRVGRYVLDMLWPRERVNVELDGWKWHRNKFERDRRRDADLQATRGIQVQRVTWRQLTTEPEAVLVRLTRTLCCAPRSAAAQ